MTPPPQATACPGTQCDIEHQYCPKGVTGATDSAYCCRFCYGAGGTYTGTWVKTTIQPENTCATNFDKKCPGWSIPAPTAPPKGVCDTISVYDGNYTHDVYEDCFLYCSTPKDPPNTATQAGVEAYFKGNQTQKSHCESCCNKESKTFCNSPLGSCMAYHHTGELV